MHIDYLVITKEKLKELDVEDYYHLQKIKHFSDPDNYYNNTKEVFSKLNETTNILVVIHVGLFWNYRLKSTLTDQIKEVVNKLDNNWTVIGNIIDEYESKKCHNPKLKVQKGKCFFKIWPQLTVINLDNWRAIGSPNLGNGQTLTGKQLPDVKPSPFMIHDNYTPLDIQKGDNAYFSDFDFIQGNECWNIIKESLENNMVVHNIPNNIRQGITYTYPEDNYDLWIATLKRFRKKALNNNDKKILVPGAPKLVKSLNTLRDLQFNNKLSHLSPFNSEGLFSPEARGHLDFLENVDCVIQPCQGWKSLVYTHGTLPTYSNPMIPKKITNDTCDYLFIDFLKDRVFNKKRFNENWKGLSYQMPKARNQNNLDESDIDGYKNLLSYFDDLPKTLETFQKQKHYYMTLNIFEDMDCIKINEFLKENNYENVLFLHSNIWTWHWNVVLFGKHALEKRRVRSIRLVGKGIKNFYYEGKAVYNENVKFTKLD